MSELDGFLTAIVSGPATVMPSDWIPALWGDRPPVLEGAKELDRVVSLIFRHMNGIAGHLTAQPDTFTPLFLQREHDGRTALIVDEWCEGYMRAVALSGDAWADGGSIVADHLASILAFCEAGGWTGHDGTARDVERRQRALAPKVRAIHAYWLARRMQDVSRIERRRAVLRPGPSAGRNDACPCGSGKKYKKCCLH